MLDTASLGTSECPGRAPRSPSVGAGRCGGRQRALTCSHGRDYQPRHSCERERERGAVTGAGARAAGLLCALWSVAPAGLPSSPVTCRGLGHGAGRLLRVRGGERGRSPVALLRLPVAGEGLLALLGQTPGFPRVPVAGSQWLEARAPPRPPLPTPVDRPALPPWRKRDRLPQSPLGASPRLCPPADRSAS